MKEVAMRKPACRIFNRIEHEGVREEFATLDRDLPSLSKQLVLKQTSNRGKYAPKGNNKGFVSGAQKWACYSTKLQRKGDINLFETLSIELEIASLV